MSDWLAAAVFWSVLLAPFGVFAWQLRRLRSGARSRGRATASFLGYAILPALGYALLFFLLVGAEELTGRALIGEGFARMLLPLGAISLAEVLVLGVVFAIVANVLRRRAARREPRDAP